MHRKYLAYYGEMGMSDGEAAAFYAMTNSAPNDRPRLVSAAEMRAWIAPEATPPPVAYHTGF